MEADFRPKLCLWACEGCSEMDSCCHSWQAASTRTTSLSTGSIEAKTWQDASWSVCYERGTMQFLHSHSSWLIGSLSWQLFCCWCLIRWSLGSCDFLLTCHQCCCRIYLGAKAAWVSVLRRHDLLSFHHCQRMDSLMTENYFNLSYYRSHFLRIRCYLDFPL